VAEVQVSKQPGGRKQPAIDRYFAAIIKMKASDLHLKGDQVPHARINGQLRQTTGNPTGQEELEQMVFEILSSEQKTQFLKNGVLDFAYEMGAASRFRINIYRQRGKIALAARHVISEIPEFESLHLPDTVRKIAEQPRGLVLVAGVTGCGKSTTIAAMLNHINRTRSCHIITVEDPIEFAFIDDKALISQREIGIDVADYDQALRSLVREDPDVVFVGEMRDYTTLTAGLRAAETGHLVFSTLHSTDAYQAITRILDLTPQAERVLIRQALVGNLRAIITQRLLPTVVADPSRIPAVEIMISNASTRKLISEGREVELPAIIKSSYGEGMIDYNESLRRLVEKDIIDVKTAYAFAPNPDELKMALKGIRSADVGIME